MDSSPGAYFNNIIFAPSPRRPRNESDRNNPLDTPAVRVRAATCTSCGPASPTCFDTVSPAAADVEHAIVTLPGVPAVTESSSAD